jgi:phage terminase large subunit
MPNENEIRIKIPPIFKPLTNDNRYTVFYGGRGAGKSWAIARYLVVLASCQKVRILCTRELQSSIADSVYRLLTDQIYSLKLDSFYSNGILKNIITSTIGSEFIFKGLSHNIGEIKSLEGVDIVWIEEAQAVSENSWSVLIPTIRKENSRFIISFNTGEEKDPTYQRFVVNPPPNTFPVKVGWQDNPYFPIVLEKERAYHEKNDPDSYQNIWEGFPLSISEAQIFKNKWREDTFEAPENTRFYFGADFGFSNDPSTLLRCYIEGNKLFIDYESYGVGIELNELSDFYKLIPESEKWIIKADNSRPETISHIKKNYGFNISAAKKWAGSVEDGISYLKKFEQIVIHSRCKHMLQEARLYSYKIDKNGEVLPIVIGKHDHCWDAIRYALDSKITNKGINWVDFIGEE